MIQRIRLATCLLSATLLAGSPLSRGAAAEPEPVRIAYVGDRSHTAWLGVSQGLEEANLQGRFLGKSYELDVVDPAGAAGADLSPFIAVVVAADAAVLTALAEAHPRLPVFNVSVEDDGLRAACIPSLLHVLPSAAMKRDAVAQWQVKNPGAKVAAAAWHPHFEKFAARDLNKRFRAAFDRPMDDYAWAGWAAVKMTTDMVVRTDVTTGAELLDHLRTRLAFDGQKGADMSFRPTGQLRQPLLIVDENGGLLGEAPVRGVAPSDTALDSLGMIECNK
jgi:hypothetical protein